MNIYSVVILFVYIIILFILSAFFVKKALHSYEEYILCGRALTVGYIIFTYLGTWIGGGTIIGLAGMSYRNGASSYWLFAISCVVSFFFALFFITRIRSLKLNSIGDMLALRYPGFKEAVRIPVAISLVIRNVTMIGMQFTALSYMLIYVLNIDRNLAVLATFVVITGYTALSGLWGVVVTDVFQGILQTIGLVVILVLTAKISGGAQGILSFFAETGRQQSLNIMGADLGVWGKEMGLYFLSFGVFFLMGDESDWQRIYSGKTDKAAFWGFLIPLTITLLLLITPTYIGVFQNAVRPTEAMDSNFIIYRFLFRMVKPLTSAFLMVTIFSAIMSSADSYMFATGVIFSNDIIKRFINRNAGERELIFWTRLAVILAGAIGFAFSINIHDVVYLWITGLAIPTMVILPAYIFAWFSKQVNTQGVLAGVLWGVLFCVALMARGGTIQLEWVILGTAGNCVITYIVSLFFPTEGDAVSRTYYKSKRFDGITLIPK